MGKGLAAEFKRRYPLHFKTYQTACRREEVRPGRVLVTDSGAMRPKWILCVPTKRHWSESSRLDDVSKGIEELARVAAMIKIDSIAIPALGCGLGGLRWSEVEPLIEKSFSNSPISVYLYPPND